MKPRVINFHSGPVLGFVRGTVFALLLLTLVSGLAAQEKFTAVDLTDWTATDGKATVGDKGMGILLPAGGQLSRTFDATSIQLRLVSRPVFSKIPADWASLEMGPASLTFVRDPDGGGMVLLGDEPLALPFGLPLDDQGRSRDSLEILLSYDQSKGTATLTFQKLDFGVEATTAAGPVEVAVSAGRATDWSLDKLEIRAAGAKASSDGGKGGGGGPSTLAKVASTAVHGKERGDALASARAMFEKDDDLAGEKALSDKNNNPKNSAEWHLETANELVQMAFSFNRAGKPNKAEQLAQRALEHTVTATRKAARQANLTPIAAAAEETAAFIEEKLLASHSGAKSFYQSAALRLPSGNAEREYQRLGRIDREARRKGGQVVTEEVKPEEIVVSPWATGKSTKTDTVGGTTP